MTDTIQLTDAVTLRVRDTTPDRFDVDATYAPHGSRPPRHSHPHHDEHFEVLEGTLRVVVDGRQQDLTPGDTLDIPRGAVHHMWNPTAAPTRVRWLSTPAGRVEAYFRAMDARPGPLALAAILHEYRDVMTPAGPLARAFVTLVGPLARR